MWCVHGCRRWRVFTLENTALHLMFHSSSDRNSAGERGSAERIEHAEGRDSVTFGCLSRWKTDSQPAATHDLPAQVESWLSFSILVFISFTTTTAACKVDQRTRQCTTAVLTAVALLLQIHKFIGTVGRKRKTESLFVCLLVAMRRRF